MSLQVADLHADLGLNSGGFTSGLSNAMGSLKSFGKNAGKVFAGLGAAAGAAGFALAGKATMTAGKFNQAMDKVRAATEATDKDMSLLRDKAKEVGRETKFSMQQIAEAEEALGKTGYGAEETAQALDGIAAAAAASGEPLEDVAKQLTNVVNAYGLTAQETGRVSDVFAEAARSSNVTIRSLSEAMKYLGPAAKDAGYSIEKTTALVGKLGDAGISAGKAGRNLRATLSRFAKMKEGMFTKRQTKMLEKYSEQILKLNPNIDSVKSGIKSGKVEILDLVEAMKKGGASTGEFGSVFEAQGKKVKNWSEEQQKAVSKFAEEIQDANNTDLPFKEALAEGKVDADKLKKNLEDAGASAGAFAQLFGQSGGTVASLLADQAGEAEKLAEKLLGAEGAAKDMAETKLDNLMGQIDKLKGSMSLLLTVIGGDLAPALKNFIKDKLIPLVNNTSKWIDDMGGISGILDSIKSKFSGVKDTAEGVKGTIGKAFSDLKSAVSPAIEFLGDHVPEIKTAVYGLGGAFAAISGAGYISTLGSALAGFATSLGSIMVPLATIGAAIVGFKKIWDNFFSDVNPLIGEIGSAFVDTFGNIWDALKQGDWEGVKTAFSEGLGSIKSKIIEVWPAIKDEMVQGFKDLGSTTKDKVKSLGPKFKNNFPDLTEKVSGVFESVKGAIDLPDLKGSFGDLKSSVSDFKETVDPLLSSIGEFFTTAGQKIKGFFTGFSTGGEDGPSQKVKDLKETVDRILSDLSGVVQSNLDVITGMFELGESVFSGDWKTAVNDAKSVTKSALEGFKEAIKVPVDAVLGILKLAGVEGVDEKWSGITDTITGFKDDLVSVLDTAGERIDTVVSTLTGFKEDAKMVFSAVSEAVSGVFGDKFPELKKSFDELGSALGEFKETAKPILETIGGLFSDAGDKVSGFFSGLFSAEGDSTPESRLETLKSTTEEILGELFELVKGQIDLITGLFELGESVLSGDWETAIEDIKDVGKTALGQVESAFKVPIETIKGILKLSGVEGVDKAWKKATEPVENFVDFFTSVPDKLDGIKSQIMDKVKGIAQSVTNKFGWVPGIGGGNDSIAGKMNDLTKRFTTKNGIPGFKGDIIDEKDVSKLKTMFENQNMAEAEKIGAIETLVSQAKEAVEQGTGSQKELSRGIERLADTFENLDLPGELDSFASGTPWTGSGSSNDIAGFVHNREAVIPPNVLKKGTSAIMDFLGLNQPKATLEVGQGSSGGSVAVEVNGPFNVRDETDIRKIAQEIAQEIKDDRRGRGIT